jgi:hypothetical protein
MCVCVCVCFWGPQRGQYEKLTTLPTVWTMWDPQHLTTPKTSTACYRDSFTLLLIHEKLAWLDLML